jgi:hypothetical protein
MDIRKETGEECTGIRMWNRISMNIRKETCEAWIR